MQDDVIVNEGDEVVVDGEEKKDDTMGEMPMDEAAPEVDAPAE